MQLIASENGIAIIRLARPPVNAFDYESVATITDLFTRLGADSATRGVVVTGAGACFSAGIDIKAWSTYTERRRSELGWAITRMTAAIVSIHVPVVMAVNGHALGGGFVFMLCGDARIAAAGESARFALPEAGRGIPFPAGPAEIIRAELPPAVLRRI